MTIEIKNKLEILKGNKIMVPGCEPVSSFTSLTLAENRKCKSTIVDLADAMNAIPDATIEMWRNPKTMFFVLPKGPAPSPSNCGVCSDVIDYYQILRDIGTEIEVQKSTPSSVCDAFPLNFSAKGIF